MGKRGGFLTGPSGKAVKLKACLAAIGAASCAGSLPTVETPRAKLAPHAPLPSLTPVASAEVLEEIVALVEQRFYSTAHLAQVGWPAAVAHARDQLVRAPDSTGRVQILRALVATLAVSHTDFYPRDHPSYWALASIFEPALQRTCGKERAPALPVTRDDIGVFWKQIGVEWFVGGVYAGGPAEQAGLLLRDRVLTADGQPFSPVTSFTAKANKPVVLPSSSANAPPAPSTSASPSASATAPSSCSPSPTPRSTASASRAAASRPISRCPSIRATPPDATPSSSAPSSS